MGNVTFDTDDFILPAVTAGSSHSLDDLADDLQDNDLSDSDTFDAEFRQSKRNYYMDKMEYEVVSE